MRFFTFFVKIKTNKKEIKMKNKNKKTPYLTNEEIAA